MLVWSLDESSLLNVKLSDYGISCFATPQGVAGEEGTPGYQAPEIRTGIGYDEKVKELKERVAELSSSCDCMLWPAKATWQNEMCLTNPNPKFMKTF